MNEYLCVALGNLWQFGICGLYKTNKYSVPRQHPADPPSHTEHIS